MTTRTTGRRKNLLERVWVRNGTIPDHIRAEYALLARRVRKLLTEKRIEYNFAIQDVLALVKELKK